MLTVVALGGNALLRPGRARDCGRAAGEPRDDVRGGRAAARGRSSCVTHGNGPQVGNELLRQELAAAEAPPLPLYVAVAQTQAEIGALVAAELAPARDGRVGRRHDPRRRGPGDPAFENPTKPVGPFYDAARAEELERDRGWTLPRTRAAAGAGSSPPRGRSRSSSWRPSAPCSTPAARSIAVGGGGIPVVAATRGLRRDRRGHRQGSRLRAPRRRSRRRAARDPHPGARRLPRASETRSRASASPS